MFCEKAILTTHTKTPELEFLLTKLQVLSSFYLLQLFISNECAPRVMSISFLFRESVLAHSDNQKNVSVALVLVVRYCNVIVARCSFMKKYKIGEKEVLNNKDHRKQVRISQNIIPPGAQSKHFQGRVGVVQLRYLEKHFLRKNKKKRSGREKVWIFFTRCS